MPKKLTPRLADLKKEIEGYAREYGLDFFDQVFEVVTYDEMNMVASYGGFPTRYPHWRFGMDYERLSKGYEYGLSKIYELVINNDPCYAYLLDTNADVDSKTVMAHVYGHNDFFKNNFYFQHTNRKMLDEMGNHATRVRRLIDRVGLDKVEAFIDRALSIENLIDHHSPYIRRRPARTDGDEEAEGSVEIPKLRVDRSYMDSYINPEAYLESQKRRIEAQREQHKRFPEHPERDVLLFLLEHAPLERWEHDLLSIIREEAYYFAPQGQTKILNEGWACVAPETLVFTSAGLLPMADVVAGRADAVADGEGPREVYDRNVIRDHATVRIRTRRGLILTGSNNHRVMRPDGSWVRLDALAESDRIRISGGSDLWPTAEADVDYDPPAPFVTLDDVADEAGVSVWTVLRHRAGRNVRREEAVAAALERYEDEENLARRGVNERRPVRLPRRVDARLGALLGYLVGDGHISRVKRHFGLTTGDAPQAEAFARLAADLFGVMPVIKEDGGRLRVLVHSEAVSDYLVRGLGLTEGPSAPRKAIPSAVLRSPEPVVRAFLRALFDADGYAGDQGVVLSTTSDALSEQVQLLLLNYGILGRRRKAKDGCWQLRVTGASAARFEARVGFGLERKAERLRTYVTARRWFKKERWEDEVVEVVHGRGDVYDISVRETHRYAAAGFVNHNSYWHSKIMTQKAVRDDEIIDYAANHAGVLSGGGPSLNPYKLGIELLRDVEDRWNKGRFGKEYDECDDMATRRSWDRQLGVGRDKIFEVRKLYNDVTFIDTFLTPEFVIEQKLFTFEFNPKTDIWEIVTRRFDEVKKKLLQQLTNFGQPIIEVVDANYQNRGELLLSHRHEGVDLKHDEALDTLRNVQAMWRRPVHLFTEVEEKGFLLSFDGETHSERHADAP